MTAAVVAVTTKRRDELELLLRSVHLGIVLRRTVGVDASDNEDSIGQTFFHAPQRNAVDLVIETTPTALCWPAQVALESSYTGNRCLR